MANPEKFLIWFLRLCGTVMLLALPAVFLPYDWMNLIHQRCGLGQLPNAPIVSYLTRSCSALYAAHGAIVLCLSTNVRRYLPLIRVFSWIGIVFGLTMLGIDLSAGMPASWTYPEGAIIVGEGSLILWLARRVTAASLAARQDQGLIESKTNSYD